VDWGFSNDPAAVVRICFDASTYTVYLHQVLYEKGLLTAAIAQAIKDDMLNRARTLYRTSTLDVMTENGAIMINGFGVDRLGSFDPKVLPKEVFDEVSRELNNIYTYVGEVYCDPARPEQIREMKIIHGLMVSGAVNKDKTGRIEYLKYFNVCYTESSKDLHNEYVNYRWKQSKTDKTRFINEAEDGNDHLMDALNYGVATHLRRLGIANRIGEQ
jgi:phage terminase large subunit